jgi:abequosyltransferase
LAIFNTKIRIISGLLNNSLKAYVRFGHKDLINNTPFSNQNMSKLLSICIPTYNRKEKLKRLLQNIVTESKGLEEHLQVCISDNASTDGTQEYLKETEKVWPFDIKLNFNNENLGMDLNILKAFDLATCKYMWLLGDDDYIAKKKLRKLLTFLNDIADEEVVLVYLSLFDDKNTKTCPKAEKIDAYKMVTDPNHFMSIDLFQRKAFCTIDKKLLDGGINTGYIHAWIIRLLGLHLPNAKGLRFTAPIVCSENSYINASLAQQLRFSMVVFGIYTRFFFSNLELPEFRNRYSMFFLKKILLSAFFPFFEILCERTFRHNGKENISLAAFIKFFNVFGIVFWCYYWLLRLLPFIINNAILKFVLFLVRVFRLTREPTYDFWKEFWTKNMDIQIQTGRSFFKNDAM